MHYDFLPSNNTAIIYRFSNSLKSFTLFFLHYVKKERIQRKQKTELGDKHILLCEFRLYLKNNYGLNRKLMLLKKFKLEQLFIKF